jgi:RNA polymerase-binding transcription factor
MGDFRAERHVTALDDQEVEAPERGETMRTIVRRRLEKDLRIAVARLRQLGGVVAIDELPGAIGDNSPGADAIDGSQLNTSREIGWATRERLVERVRQLSKALDRLHNGEYGVCIECDERISPARLHAVPEVETCVPCQHRLERRDRQLSPGRERLFALAETD